MPPLVQRGLVLLGLVLGLARCVPTDDALPLGSAEFTFSRSTATENGVVSKEFTVSPMGYELVDPWNLEFDRIVLGFKTMTIGQVGVPEVCSYRGRGAVSDVVFHPRNPIVQSFNGLQPVVCPDVGVILGPPDNETTLGPGVPSSDLIELASGRPAHAIVEATATRFGDARSVTPLRLKIKLRFDSERTATRFGGCRAATRGVRILANQREQVVLRFAAENLFRNAISTPSGLNVVPFFLADLQGNRDGVVTMEELDALPLDAIPVAAYTLPDGSRDGSFGDFVRILFRMTLLFRTEDGLCIGNEPGAEE